MMEREKEDNAEDIKKEKSAVNEEKGEQRFCFQVKSSNTVTGVAISVHNWGGGGGGGGWHVYGISQRGRVREAKQFLFLNDLTLDSGAPQSPNGKMSPILNNAVHVSLQ